MASAVWDGANRDRDGQKATSPWFTLQMEGQAKGGILSAKIGLVLFVLSGVFMIGSVWLAPPSRREQPASQSDTSSGSGSQS